MPEHRTQLIQLIAERGYERRDEPFTLSSGERSYDYVDAKRAIATAEGLRLACEAILEQAADVRYDAVGGLTMGADPLAHGVALLGGTAWFSVRKAAKGHGKQRRIEGARLRPGMRVLVVDDVVTTGSSILQAVEAVREESVEVALAVTLLDRGEAAGRAMADLAVAYRPLATYRDLGIDPVGGAAA